MRASSGSNRIFRSLLKKWCAGGGSVKAIVAAHQWPSVITVWCLENYRRISEVQCRPRTTRAIRRSRDIIDVRYTGSSSSARSRASAFTLPPHLNVRGPLFLSHSYQYAWLAWLSIYLSTLPIYASHI
ncbi:hypothetical protein EVAR_21352_1 [Eumeta japonica]|uniref:Uncharacterized protein n=1 Tax=Eumeta variegata TaxID=151549 RepID=A0A4C1YBD7_EUMVA|nr:hypothetical protein EVAR_21352_1 [Eumeta japonica]